MVLRILLSCLMSMLSVCGCASSRQSELVAPAKPVLPAPATTSGHVTFKVHLPPDAAKNWGMPHIDGKLDFEIKAEALSATLSHYDATIRVHVTSPDGQQTYVLFDTTISGQIDGTPTQATAAAFKRLLDMFTLTSRSTEPALHPSTAPGVPR